MSRKVYFAFHYKDVISFRANVVRNHWVTKPNRQYAGYFDASIWEEAKKKGDLALKCLINSGLQNTSVTAVLIGTETFARPWVRYEIIKSFTRSNGLIGIYIHNITDKNKMVLNQGPNPFDYLYYRILANNQVEFWEHDGQWRKFTDLPACSSLFVKYKLKKEGKFSEIFRTYDWVHSDGYGNFSDWVENAAAAAGKQPDFMYLIGKALASRGK